MPSFSLPCWPRATASSFNRGERLPSTNKNDDDLQKPSVSEYASETAREFLKVLEAVAHDIPVPGLAAAVKLATNLIQACEESHATLERAEELKLRIKTLVTVLVDELKGKKAEEIQEELKRDVKSLEQDLQYIRTKLDAIASQHALLVVFFRGINEDRVRKCVGRLNNSMERFHLSREIDHASVLHNLEKQIVAFHSSQQKSLDRIQVTMDDVKAILNERLPTSATSRSRAGVPTNTEIFYGRDDLVAKLSHILANTQEGKKGSRVCLLGPGGMGKTSTALATMAHPELKTRFPVVNQVWIPCVKATSISLFLDTLYSSLGTSRNSGNTRNDILAELRASEPLILLLDNFETPWNVDGGRSDVERILRDLDQISHLTLFITMRSSSPPCDGIHWHSLDLRAVDADAARKIYSAIYPSGGTDPNLPKLLDVVGHMPLAVTLMAKVAKITRLTAEELIGEYNQLGTALLGQGSDAEHSMDVCIGLSVDSPSMRKHPEALKILAAIAMLPVGTTFKMLKHWWAQGSQNLVGALEVLSETSLVERRDTTIFVLPVIRSYVLHPSRFPDEVRTSMTQAACDFLSQHRSSPGDALYKEHTSALSVEEGNLEAILLDTTVPTPTLLDGLLILASHQELLRPRTDVIEHALKLLRTMDNTTLLGPALVCYGSILYGLGRYDSAIEHLTLAHKAFLSISDKSRAAECLLKLAEIHSYTQEVPFEEQKALIEDAKSCFESLHDTRGVALCLCHLGNLHLYCTSGGDRSAGLDLFLRAQTMLSDLLDTTHLAHFSLDLGWAYFWHADYDNAKTAAMSTVEAYERIGYHETSTQRLISRIYIVKGDYGSALQSLVQSLQRSESRGDPLDIARLLRDMGCCWAKMGNKADAQGAFEESRRYYSSLQTKDGDKNVSMCDFFLRRLEDPLLVPSHEDQATWLDNYPEDTAEIMSLVR